jgi:excisionase family DNA binding protein
VSELVRVLLDELADDPVALARLRELVAPSTAEPTYTPAAYTVATLAVELGRTECSIRAAIKRGQLHAVKRGRGYVISADAVGEWARASTDGSRHQVARRRRSNSGPMRRALKGSA